MIRALLLLACLLLVTAGGCRCERQAAGGAVIDLRDDAGRAAPR